MNEKSVRVLKRKQQPVVRFNVELFVPLNKRLEDWCKNYGWSKRKVIEDALHCWLNQRELEKQERKK